MIPIIIKYLHGHSVFKKKNELTNDDKMAPLKQAMMGFYYKIYLSDDGESHAWTHFSWTAHTKECLYIMCTAVKLTV